MPVSSSPVCRMPLVLAANAGLAGLAGLAAAGALAGHATSSQPGANLRRTVALGSTGVTFAAGATTYLGRE